MTNIISLKKEIINLVQKLNLAIIAYYVKDDPIMTDKEFDDKMDHLVILETQTGIHLPNSPTNKVGGQVEKGSIPVTHSSPMLSAAKTKHVEDIVKFAADRKTIISWKEDGLTIVVRYKNGQYVQGITRGNGFVGEDKTEQVRQISNMPLTISYKEDLEVRGECVLPWGKYNELKSADPELGHPRNVAGGAVRHLDPSVTKNKGLIFKPFAVIVGGPQFELVSAQYDWLRILGFDPVEYKIAQGEADITKKISSFQPTEYEYPVDGIIIAFNDIQYGKSLGRTEHHPLNMMALKWKDETYDTVFRGIDYAVTKTGVISMTAIFDPVEIDHTTVSRALIPNLPYFDKFRLGVGDVIRVYKANKIIPQIDSNETASGTYQLPVVCPCCKSELRKTDLNLICDNSDCPAKNVRLYEAFCGKKGFNIDGLAGKTIEKLVEHGYVKQFSDILTLPENNNGLKDLLGSKATVNLLANIIKSRNAITLSHLIASLSIPGIGLHDGKTLSKAFKTGEGLLKALSLSTDLTELDGIGQETDKAIHEWYHNNFPQLRKIMDLCEIKPDSFTDATAANPFSGKTIVPTGTLKHFTRSEIQAKIESFGAKFGTSVSKKTDYVLAGESAGSKLTKAQQLGIKVLSEEEFIEMAEK